MKLADSFLGQTVQIIVDRPLGSRHPKHGFLYPINYGYVPGTLSGDGYELDAYIVGVSRSIENFEGRCIAIVRRLDDDDDKLIIVPQGVEVTNDEIEEAIHFQEQWFTHKMIH